MSNARKLADNLPSEGSLSERNVIINGDMNVAQRAISQTAAGYGSVDRWIMSLSGATATMSQQSFTAGQTDVSGSEKYLKLAVSTGNNNSGIYQKIEAKNIFHFINNKATLSYYAKGTSPASGLEVHIGWYDGSTFTGTTSVYVTLTSTWTKYTHTFDVPSISGINLTSANTHLELKWAQANADTGTGAYEVNLAQTQLEVGSQSTPFEHEPVGVTLRKCQRYFTNMYYGSTAANAGYANSYGSYLPTPVVMRATPTASLNTVFAQYPGATHITPTINVTGGPGSTNGEQTFIRPFHPGNNGSNYLEGAINVDAEL